MMKAVRLNLPSSIFTHAGFCLTRHTRSIPPQLADPRSKTVGALSDTLNLPKSWRTEEQETRTED